MTIILFAIGILMGSIGSICLKIGGSALPSFSFSLNYFLQLFGNKYILAGFALYFLPALIWIYLLTKYPISFVQPILAITYVLTPLLAFWILKEPVGITRWLGITVIIIGVIIVSRTVK